MQPLIKNNLPEIQKLMRTYGVEQAYLFGSAASGKMKADSDVDFLIRFSPNMDFQTYGNNYFKLLYALQDLLKLQVELVAEETLNNPYLIESIDSNKLLVL
ncbi:nucleotidyltransferase family protein [Mucilaginibacter arboris]|uniref:Nucleotidyltransferase domain-containing protein n=1 Tax=Mucilaginibacter arboris TaxID=2682090 RepID=A0A7K1SV15_9SPHI|nr:nucleotidyltransferase domain-containing protein [Mucilaginibacter arboris]MVN21165.1 nucleotidyltransferase domain-containing protein [Mucilaginibacter arboris]